MFLLVATLIMTSFLFTPGRSVEAANASKKNVDIQEYAADMQPGWNLGNTFDAVGTDETAWGNPHVTKEFIEQIAAQGYKSIRIPVTFDQRMAPGPGYKINADFLSRLEQVVQWSLDEGMYVMINIHHDSWIWISDGMKNNHDATVERYNAIWKQLAKRFKQYPNQLMFESLNEPQFGGTSEEQDQYLHELNASFHEIVRKSGGKNKVRPLVLPTLHTGSEDHKINALLETISELNDPNIISTVHYYGFWPFSVNVAGYTQFEEDTKNDIINTFDRVHDAFTTKGIPVVIGEYGLLGFDTALGTIQQGEKLKFFEFMIHYAQEKELTHMLWDNGQHFGRESFKWSNPALYNMMKTSWEMRSSTAESDFIYLKSGEDIIDEEITLNLNGNQFVSLQLDGENLQEGQDYVLNDDRLTLKESLLTRLTASNLIGTNAVITATFNQGADWDINVISYQTPVTESSNGTISDFAIPTEFNGDHLATMEAVYTDGRNAGPQGWTSYKEFGYTFEPLYDKNEVVIKQNFFNEVDNGEVLITLHFWSGEKISYKLTKDGNDVIGTPLAVVNN
jgi:endoglucanase